MDYLKLGLAGRTIYNTLPTGQSKLIVRMTPRSNPAPTPSWRGSAVLSYVPSDEAYETPTPSPDEYSYLEPYSFYDTRYPVTESSTAPRPQYSTVVNVRTTTWVLSRSTTITSVILETYYSTLTEIESSAEAGTVAETAPSCATVSGYPSTYGYGCLSSSSSTSSFQSAMTTITWSPEVTAYPLPSNSDDERASPASTTTTTTSSASVTTTKSDETPPVVTGGGAPLPQAADARALGALAALLAVLV
ncbi:hypothetical protein TARUN_5900 [Trichoderma arundinaceum]|uniref:Uncharacterized protein n=1 Tax=Trichoderma arundinaceum TaxID=490622 RepID=A0A395NKL2_TRIAR|nr:hypothetical protein TARUN_5900 [Trichoderma arundinaceum]